MPDDQKLVTFIHCVKRCSKLESIIPIGAVLMESVKSYRTARIVIALLTVLAWIGVALGALLAVVGGFAGADLGPGMGGMSDMGPFARMPGVFAALPGIATAISGLFSVAALQVASAVLDASTATQRTAAHLAARVAEAP